MEETELVEAEQFFTELIRNQENKNTVEGNDDNTAILLHSEEDW